MRRLFDGAGFDVAEAEEGVQARARGPPQPPAVYIRMRAQCARSAPVAAVCARSARARMTRAVPRAQALRLLAEADTLPDAMIVNAELPTLSGLEVVERVRAVLTEHVLPIVLVSSDALQDFMEEGLPAGCNDYGAHAHARI